MEKWIIRYWDSGASKNSLEAWLDKLDKDQFKSLSKDLKMLSIVGNKLRLPQSRSLGKGLFELREHRFGLRIYYAFLNHYVILLLAAGNKTSRTHDIQIARGRLASICIK